MHVHHDSYEPRYFPCVEGKRQVAETLEINANVYADYDAHGRLLGVEAIGPWEGDVDDQITGIEDEP